jgi:hypothetical protein
VTVGAGGVAQFNDGTTTNFNGVNGNNSTIFGLTALGGGGGGSGGNNGSSGGSGGGGGENVNRLGGAGTAGQGFAGGNGNTSGEWNGGGGGGGAGAAGQNAQVRANPGGGNGGAGLSSSITGTAIFYAGGGGGSAYGGSTSLAANVKNHGAGGAGGGGAGGTANGFAGTANTGGGGGGGSSNGDASGRGGNGGSGIVIVRYAVATGITQGTSSTGNTATGGTITTVSSGGATFTAHAFTSSGTFSPNASFAIDYLVVAGGGGGGTDMGGGGGGGGYIAAQQTVLNAGTFPIVVGAGGQGAPQTAANTNAPGSNGNNSTFNGLTAIGGGGGASNHANTISNAGNGGSGGGGSGGRMSSNSYGGLPGTGTAGQGFNGAGSGLTWYPGGGGGAGGAASQPGSSQANGGVGRENNILGTSLFWAGGGAGAGYSTFGGNGGLGGGGGGAPRQGAGTENGTGGGSALNPGGLATIGTINAQTNVPGGAGGANTGGGGGGGSHYVGAAVGGNGGSGIVVIRYISSYLELIAIQAAPAVTLNSFLENSGITPVASIGGVSVQYLISPALPPGLTFNTATGVISGRPQPGSTPVTDTVYTVTAKSSVAIDDSVSETFTLTTITTATLTATVLIPTVTFNRFTVNPIVIPMVFDGGYSPFVYSISPALPDGLFFNRLTSEISGQPLDQTSGTYTITQTDYYQNTGTGTFTLVTTLELPEITATGGTESTVTIGSSIYKLHLFTGSGTLNISESNNRFIEYLVVGGGGGGGSDMGGGGGAGGYAQSQSALAIGQYTITVGAGGTGAPAGTDQVRGNSGNSSAIVPVGFKGHSFAFDGVRDNLRINYNVALHLSNDFTIECWYFANRFDSMIINFAGGLNIGWASYELYASPDGSINFAASSANAGYDIGSETGPTGRMGSVAQDTWNHLAVTRSGNVYRGFINGVQGYTQTLALAPYNPNARGLAIGSNYTGSGQWGSAGAVVASVTGFISNLRIVKGTAVYTENFIPPTAPLTAIAGTSLLTAQDLSFTDNSTNNFTLLSSGDTASSYFNPFTSLSVSSAGGGGGASDHTSPAVTSAASFGGSGGGASGNNANNAQGIRGQGNAGAASIGSWFPGGGGGAGSAGFVSPANGGAGIQNNFLGINYFWAGGGGGAGYTGDPGNGGRGGGGGGAPQQSNSGFGDTNGINPGQNAGIGAINAQANVPGGAGGTNTGGGGGGGAHWTTTNSGGAGGSGIVAIRYLLTLPALRSETRLNEVRINKFDTVNVRPVVALDGTPPRVFSISPALPQGLSFNTATGVITGAPTEITDGFKLFTVTITDDTEAVVSSSFNLSTSTGYLNSIDLVVNSTLSIQVVKGISEDERSTSEIIPYNTTVLVDDFATDKNLYFGNTATVTVNSSSSDFNYNAAVSTTTVEHSFHNYVSLNSQFEQRFGAAIVGVTGFVVDEQEFTTPGSYTWTVPEGVTAISAVAVGGGGGGSQKIAGGSGGGGGELSFVNGVSVTPGTTYTVVIGSGGTTGGANGNNGGSTYLINNTTQEVLLLASGGTGGDAMNWITSTIFYEVFNTSQSIDFGAVDPQGRTITYSVLSGSLPAGFSLNSSTGVINYISQSITEDTTHPTFTLSASVSGQTITRIVTIKVNMLLIGTTAEFPASSATALQSAGITTDGSYFITINSQAVQCHVNFTLPGGPYILAMTTSNTGSNYGFDSTVWTDTTGGSTLALDPASNTNQVSYAFYHLATSRTGLSLHENIADYMHYINHASFTARALANGAVAVPTAVTPNNTSNAGGTLIENGQVARAQGWFDAVAAAGFSAMTVGTTYYRYGWQHGTPDPVQFGYARFGWTADIDSSDSRDRAIGIGLKNSGGGPVGTYTVSSGYFDYSNGAKNNIRSWLWIKN